MSLKEISLLAETIIGMICCTCMDRIFWLKVEIESSENRQGSCGLSWCLFTNLAAPAPLLLSPCWWIVCSMSHRYTESSYKIWKRKKNVRGSFKLLIFCWLWTTEPTFTGKEIRILLELQAKPLLQWASRGQETATFLPKSALNSLLFNLLYVSCFLALPCCICPHQVC